MGVVNTATSDAFGRTADERDEIREKVRVADQLAKDNWYDEDFRKEMLKDLVEVTFEGFMHETLLDLYSTVETVGEFERITLEEVQGLEVFWTSLGGQIDNSRLTERVWELPRDLVGFAVYELEKKIRSGFSRAQSNIVSLAISQMDAEVNARLFRTLQAAIGVGSPYYSSGAGLDIADVNTGISQVGDETLEDTVAIVGRRTMIDQILDALQDNNLFAPETNEQIIQLGVMGRYRGAPIIRLKNHKDRNEQPFFPGNELWIVGRDASKTGFWGGLTGQEWTEPGGFYWHYMATREAGFAVHRPERARRIVDESLSA